MSGKFRIAETEEYAGLREKPVYKKLFKKIDEQIYKQLQSNPFFGPHIKKLKGEFKDVYRYRSGNFRILYIIDKSKIIVIMLTIHHRKAAYKK